MVKREPGTLGMRKWSLYGRLYLRHFNELEHEINARLVRAYRPAAKYMGIFTTPLLTIIAQYARKHKKIFCALAQMCNNNYKHLYFSAET